MDHSTPPPANPSAVQPRSEKRRSRSSLAISALLHGTFIIIAGFIVALNVTDKPQATFIAEQAVRPSMKPEEIKLKVKVEDLQRRSAPPRLKPRMLSSSPSDLALPEIKPDPNAKNQKVRQTVTTLGMSGFGSGIGGGFGTGSGGGTSFFGLKAHGRRIAYIVDFSSSMNGGKSDLARKELIKSIQMLPPQCVVSLIFFSGPHFCLRNGSCIQSPKLETRIRWLDRPAACGALAVTQRGNHFFHDPIHRINSFDRRYRLEATV